MTTTPNTPPSPHPITIDDAVAICINYIPRCVEFAREEGCTEDVLSDQGIAHLACGMWLFQLNGRLPYSEEENLRKMEYAFNRMWELIAVGGGDPEKARVWLRLFGQEACNFAPPVDRHEVILSAMRRGFQKDESEESKRFATTIANQLAFMPHVLSAGLDGMKGFALRSDN